MTPQYEEAESIIASQDITDEMRIQFTIDKFYEILETFSGSNKQMLKLKILRNNLINMMDTYLKKFKNQIIMESFYKKLREAKKQATHNGSISKYYQYMNEIRVIQEFKGIQEDISDKLAEQLFELFKNSEMIQNG